MSGKRTRETRTAGGNRRQQPQYYCTGTGVVSTLEADASAPLGDLALSSNTAMANACTGDLGGICGGNHRSGVCICAFWVPGSARGVAGRAFPAMLRARARREGGCQFSVIYTGGGGSRNRTVGRGPFFSHRGSTFLCDSSRCQDFVTFFTEKTGPSYLSKYAESVISYPPKHTNVQPWNSSKH